MNELSKALSNYFNVVLKQFFKYQEEYTINYFSSVNSFYIRPYSEIVTFWNKLTNKELTQIINNLETSIGNKYSRLSVGVDKNAIIIR